MFSYNTIEVHGNFTASFPFAPRCGANGDGRISEKGIERGVRIEEKENKTAGIGSGSYDTGNQPFRLQLGSRPKNVALQ